MSAFRRFVETHGLDQPAKGIAISKTAGRKDLGVLFKQLGYRRGAEIGVWAGEFSEQLCLANHGVKLICVDPWTAYPEYGDPKNTQHRLDAARLTALTRLHPYRCDVKRMTSIAAAATVKDGSLDFVYLDGNHGKDYVLADLAAWAPKVRPGGIVSGHYYEIKKKHAHLLVQEAVDEFARVHSIAPIYILTNDGSPSFFWRVA